MTTLVFIVLGAWLLASLANQFAGPWTRSLRALNWCSLLPRLAFFAPDPIDVDYHLAYRDLLDDDEPGPWQSLAIERDGRWRLLWSPAKRDYQSLLEAVAALALLQNAVTPAVEDAESLLQLSLPYLFLLHLVQHAPARPSTRERQFMVVESNGFGPSRHLALGILSSFHRLA